MLDTTATNLAALFQASLDALTRERVALNQADAINGNHGDHMVEIFQIAVEAAQEDDPTDLAAAMERASVRLARLPDNGSARLYAHGLESFARRFRENEVAMADLLNYVRRQLGGKVKSHEGSSDTPVDAGPVLKALVSGLADWSGTETQPGTHSRPIGLDALFGLGLAYLQARQRGGSKAEILAEAAISASPLSAVPHRLSSGRLAIRALLEAAQAEAS